MGNGLAVHSCLPPWCTHADHSPHPRVGQVPHRWVVPGEGLAQLIPASSLREARGLHSPGPASPASITTTGCRTPACCLLPCGPRAPGSRETPHAQGLIIEGRALVLGREQVTAAGTAVSHPPRPHPLVGGSSAGMGCWHPLLGRGASSKQLGVARAGSPGAALLLHS